LHTFRHTFVSLALTRGIDPATVRKWVRHIDRQTLDFHTHIAARIRTRRWSGWRHQFMSDVRVRDGLVFSTFLAQSKETALCMDRKMLASNKLRLLKV
jgi:hypothetical protein